MPTHFDAVFTKVSTTSDIDQMRSCCTVRCCVKHWIHCFSYRLICSASLSVKLWLVSRMFKIFWKNHHEEPLTLSTSLLPTNLSVAAPHWDASWNTRSKQLMHSASYHPMHITSCWCTDFLASWFAVHHFLSNSDWGRESLKDFDNPIKTSSFFTISQAVTNLSRKY